MAQTHKIKPIINSEAELTVFPVETDLEAAILYAQSHLPITDKNALIAILGTYHNTLVRERHKEK